VFFLMLLLGLDGLVINNSSRVSSLDAALLGMG
jgi:hypothetical protein